MNNETGLLVQRRLWDHEEDAAPSWYINTPGSVVLEGLVEP